ncbi:MAG: hypothetical protein HYX90_08520 [Chloroflexi bacterium]|nr:hypothetical protein [Chloroflexota bacterium]
MKLGLGTKTTGLDKLFALAALLLLVMLFVFYSGGKKAGRELADLRKQVESAAREARAAQSSGDLDAAKKRLNELQGAALSFPSSSQAEEVAGALWTWAQQSGVNLEQMGYTVTASTLGEWSYPAHSFPLSGKGTPDGMSDFLHRLETAPLRTTGVSQLQLTPAQGGAWQFSLVFTVWSQATKIEKKAGS